MIGSGVSFEPTGLGSMRSIEFGDGRFELLRLLDELLRFSDQLL